MKRTIKNPFLMPALIAGLNFMAAGRVTAQSFVNFDGVNPNAGLILSGGTLYGTAAAGGGSGYGTVFAISTNGTRFSVLHSFTGGTDGAHPWDGLILSGNTLYGTAYDGGIWGYGTVFAIITDGTGFTSLHSFTMGSDGGGPIGGLVLTNDTLYGTTELGGSSGKGTVFSISLPPPQLTITPSGADVVVTWPANVTGFYLQVTVNLGDAAGWAATALPQPPTIVNGQYVVTIPDTIVGQHFYRLSR